MPAQAEPNDGVAYKSITNGFVDAVSSHIPEIASAVEQWAVLSKVAPRKSNVIVRPLHLIKLLEQDLEWSDDY